MRLQRSRRSTVGSHELKAQRFRARVSNPRVMAYPNLKLPSKSKSCEGLGPFLHIELLTCDRSKASVSYRTARSAAQQ